MKALPIWEQKYKDNTVLVACSKVTNGENYIFFCMDKDYENLYSFDGDKAIKEAPIVNNSKIYCYAIPMSDLKDCGALPERFQKVKEKEIVKYRRKISS